MKKFDTKVQYLKYKVLREVAKYGFEDNLGNCYTDIPKHIVKGNKSKMRCCIYKERAIVIERIKMAMGGDVENKNVIEVIDIACDECPVSGYSVSEACRGCIAHRCESVCPRNAIFFDKYQKACIDKSKCVECGKCANVCPYSAIVDHKRPCEKACKVNAISISKNEYAEIDNDKCISCGSCVYQCPFGAITDKSFILNVVKMLKNSDNNKKYKVYAVVAPSVSSQFTYAKLGQVVKGIKNLGFHTVIEAALGADMVANEESKELVEKGFLTSSCCPAFVDYIEKNQPMLKKDISHNPSPMVAIGKYIKKIDKTAKVIFIGPCTAKKMEFQKEGISNYIDSVLTFEELQALIDSKNIDLATLEEEYLENASYYGRIFARSGGLADAVKQALKENNLEKFEYNPISCNGIEECKMVLLKASKKIINNNFIEGMACKGGCIGGAGCLTHEAKDKNEVDKYGEEAFEKDIKGALSVLVDYL
jgi:[FeFe] hydrogenase (group B1/B3)